MSFLLLHRTSSTRLRSHHQCLHHHHQTLRFFIEARVKLVRERGLDHAVEREKHLQPMLALKNLIKSEPTKSIPISVASDNRTHLALPTRAADFIRKYPSIFEEFLPPGASPARPHVRLTPEVLGLDEEEQLVYQRESYRQDVANRLLRLIMLTRVNSIPITIIDRFKWDLGLPPDYARTLVTDFPDYFQISTLKGAGANGNGKSMLALELVCWIDEFAVSVTEKKARGYRKGMPLSFPIQYSRGYEVEKKVKIWLDEWQKLPYISPYEDASHLQSKSDQAEKWTVAVLHELLHLFISKKTDRDNIFCLSEYLGFGARFKRVLVTHPGIFYVSNKIRTKTVVLREAFKRDLLLEKHPLMSMRYQYIHLMNKIVDRVKPTSSTTTAEQKRKPRADEEGMEAEDANDDAYDKDSEDEDEDEDEVEDESEDEVEDESEDEDDNELGSHQTMGRGRMARNTYGHAETKTASRTVARTSSNRSGPNMVGDRVPTPPRRTNSRNGYNSEVRSPGRTGYNTDVRSPGRTDHSKTRVRLATEKGRRTNTRY